MSEKMLKIMTVKEHSEMHSKTLKTIEFMAKEIDDLKRKIWLLEVDRMKLIEELKNAKNGKKRI